MSKIKRRTKIATCIIFLTLGVGFCIAGLFFPGLMVMGGSFLASGLALASHILGAKEGVSESSSTSDHSMTDETSTTASSTSTSRRNIDLENKPKRSLFGFMNKKFMKHHEDLEHVNDPNETESNAMHVSPQLREEIQRLHESLAQIDKIAQGIENSSTSRDESNSL